MSREGAGVHHCGWKRCSCRFRAGCGGACQKRPRGPMNKEPAYEARGCGFESRRRLPLSTPSFQAEDDRRIRVRVAVSRCAWYPFHQSAVKRNHWSSRRNGCINTVAMRNCPRELSVDERAYSTCRRIASSMQRFDLFCCLHVSYAVCGY